ncbi:MAG: enoyl-CoA hydratase/isomerase family protein [Oligoflexales bacterium]|nr:enoyl-CoA hydratase/isomerase family protein [Oligoflexales bacterium]
MEYKNLIVENSEHISLIKINRPESLNALNDELVTELDHAIDWLAREEDVRAAVITGAGEKSFVAGADIREMLDMNPSGGHVFARRGQLMLEKLGACPKPVVAAVNGYALGGGLELALACDFIYASSKAKLGLPETTLGVIPGYGGTQNLVRLVGRQKANELVFSGRMLSAAEAVEWGIVNAVFPPEELLTRTFETVRAIVRNGPLAVAFAKDAIRNGESMGRDDGLRYEGALFASLFQSHDRIEGMRAFVEKRKAEFRGK